MKSHFWTKITIFMFSGLFLTAWASFIKRSPLEYALKSIQKNKETSGLGWSVSTSSDGKTYIAGAPYFQALIEDSGVNTWGYALLKDKDNKGSLQLTNFGIPSGTLLGSSVAISPEGDVVVLGGPGGGDHKAKLGYIALFVKGKNGWKAPSGKDKNGNDKPYPMTMGLPAPKHWKGYGFGYKVDLSKNGRTLVVGIPGYEGYGKVYCMIPPKNGWSAMKSMKEVTECFLGISNPKKGDLFGAAVAISEDDSTIIVGAPGRNDNRGGVYLFKKPKDGWPNVTQLLPYESNDFPAGYRFGESVAVSKDGSVFVVGAPGKPGQKGRVYIFVYSKKKKDYLEYTLENPHQGLNNFGISVTVSANAKTIVVGGYGENNRGCIWIYKSVSGTWKDGKYIDQVAFKKDVEGAKGALFGFSIDLTGDGKRVLIGVPLFKSGVGDLFWKDL